MCFTKFDFRNSSESILTVWLEPWAKQFDIAPQESIHVILDSMLEQPAEIEYATTAILVHGMSGAFAKVISSKGQIWECHMRLPVVSS